VQKAASQVTHIVLTAVRYYAVLKPQAGAAQKRMYIGIQIVQVLATAADGLKTGAVEIDAAVLTLAQMLFLTIP